MSAVARPQAAPAPAWAPPAASPARPAEVELELSDDELGRVVGGLERVFLFGPGLAPPQGQPSR